MHRLDEASSIGMEVPQQSHGPHGEAGGIGRAMQVAHRVEAPVLMVHEPIERVGGAMGAREAIRAGELRPFAAELQDHQPDAPSGRCAVAHSRRRRSLWENCARVHES